MRRARAVWPKNKQEHINFSRFPIMKNNISWLPEFPFTNNLLFLLYSAEIMTCSSGNKPHVTSQTPSVNNPCIIQQQSRNIPHKNLKTHLDDLRALVYWAEKSVTVWRRRDDGGRPNTGCSTPIQATPRSTEAALPHSTAVLSVLQFLVSSKVHCPPEARRPGRLQGKTIIKSDKYFFFLSFFSKWKWCAKYFKTRSPWRHRQYTKR